MIAATLLVYQQAWHAGYIWDDDVYVTQNKLLTAADGLRRIWFSFDSPSQYFPLVYTTFRLEHAIWGFQSTGYHWVNFALHAINALLVWRLLRVLNVPGAWLGAALFALHPVQVESVAWITERKNVLMGFFFLLALLSWVEFVDEKRAKKSGFYALALVFYVLALFSKTTACTMPAALFLILWWQGKTITWKRIAQVVPFVLLGIGGGLLTIWWERYHQGTQGELFSIDFPTRILVASRALWFYLGKLFWPAHLAFSYPRWEISVSNSLDYFWLCLTVGAGCAIYFTRKFFGRGVEVAALFFVATLSPVLGFIMLYTFRYSFVADHYQYLASIGPLALAAAGVTTAFEFFGRKKEILRIVFCGALLLTLGLETWRQAGTYADLETLWRATIATNPESWMAHGNLGIELSHKGETDAALTELDQALAINPAAAEMQYNRANVLFRAGRIDEAIAGYKKALELNPRIAAAHANLGAALLQSGLTTEAMSHLGMALQIDPGNGVAHRQLGEALIRLGRNDEAVAELEKAFQIDPNNAEIAYSLGDVFFRSGNFPEAAAHFRKSLEINPNLASPHNGLANCLARFGELDQAIAEYRRALEINPNYAAAHYNLGKTLQLIGQEEEGAIHLQRAEEIDAQAGRGQSPPK